MVDGSREGFICHFFISEQFLTLLMPCHRTVVIEKQYLNIGIMLLEMRKRSIRKKETNAR